MAVSDDRTARRRKPTPAVEEEAKPRRRRPASGPVRVWNECSVTLPVDDTTAHVRFLVGFEKLAPSDAHSAIMKTEQEIYEMCEEAVEKRIKRLLRVTRSTTSGRRRT